MKDIILRLKLDQLWDGSSNEALSSAKDSYFYLFDEQYLKNEIDKRRSDGALYQIAHELIKSKFSIVKNLTYKQRFVVKALTAGHKIRNIAAVLECSPRAVNQLKNKAKGKIKEYIERRLKSAD